MPFGSQNKQQPAALIKAASAPIVSPLTLPVDYTQCHEHGVAQPLGLFNSE